MIKSISLFIKNVGYNILSDFSNKVVNAVIILLISHYIGVTEMGSYSVAHTFFSFGLMFSYWGFGTLLTREVARNKKLTNKYLTNFIVLRIFFALIIIAIINIIIPFFGYSDSTEITIRIISIGILANTINNLLFSLFIAYEELKYISLASIIIGALKLMICFLVLLFGGSVISLVIFFAVLEFIGLALSFSLATKILKKVKMDLDLQFSLNQISIALPFFWISILVILDSRLEIIIISFLFSETLAGYYTATNTIMGGFSLFSEGLRNAVFPLFARYQTSSLSQLNDLLLTLGKYILMITVPISINVYWLSDEVVTLFFGQDYRLSISFLQIIIWTFISHSLTVIAIRMLIVLNKEKLLALSLLISSSLTVGLNFIFAEIFGPKGIAIVRLITSFLLFFLCHYFLSKNHFSLFQLPTLLRILGANCILSFLLFLIIPLNIYVAILFGNVIYILLLWFMKVVQKKELIFWKDFIFSIFGKNL